jgi:NAD(P)-dependent dehydrogenase (short-subunit alcohol dehydrogenase family)
MDNHGRIALVTGGSRGIGLAIAGALVASGADVVITGRDQSHLEASVSKLSSTKVAGVRADVRDPADAAQAVAATVERFGGLDILINNAGVGLFANVAEMSVEAWRQVFDTNVTGAFYCCREAIPRMRQRGGGWIVNISSLAGANPFPGGAAYCASKAALNAFGEALMQEVRYDDIRVSTVLPGSVASGFGGRGDQGLADWKLMPADVARVVLDLIAHSARSLPSRVELRPSKPPRR